MVAVERSMGRLEAVAEDSWSLVQCLDTLEELSDTLQHIDM